jgi:hypothetical protein
MNEVIRFGLEALMLRTKCIHVLLISYLLAACFGAKAAGQLVGDADAKRFDKDGMVFDYAPNWEFSDQSNPAAQQLVLTEKALDAQIMIVALRGALTSSKQEEQAKAALIEPSIIRLLKQYESAEINVERSLATGEIGDSPAEGAQLRFMVDGQPGTTDIYWRVINQRLVQLFFIRPEKTKSKTTGCWDMVRSTLRIEKPTKTKQ